MVKAELLESQSRRVELASVVMRLAKNLLHSRSDERGTYVQTRCVRELGDRLNVYGRMATEYPQYSNDRGNARYTGKGHR